MSTLTEEYEAAKRTVLADLDRIRVLIETDEIYPAWSAHLTNRINMITLRNYYNMMPAPESPAE